MTGGFSNQRNFQWMQNEKIIVCSLSERSMKGELGIQKDERCDMSQN